jgi:hypothetical protein
MQSLIHPITHNPQDPPDLILLADFLQSQLLLLHTYPAIASLKESTILEIQLK